MKTLDESPWWKSLVEVFDGDSWWKPLMETLGGWMFLVKALDECF